MSATPAPLDGDRASCRHQFALIDPIGMHQDSNPRIRQQHDQILVTPISADLITRWFTNRSALRSPFA
jgi:hypothetical protein